MTTRPVYRANPIVLRVRTGPTIAPAVNIIWSCMSTSAIRRARKTPTKPRTPSEYYYWVNFCQNYFDSEPWVFKIQQFFSTVGRILLLWITKSLKQQKNIICWSKIFRSVGFWRKESKRTRFRIFWDNRGIYFWKNCFRSNDFSIK
jgi:hypothetical protein